MTERESIEQAKRLVEDLEKLESEMTIVKKWYDRYSLTNGVLEDKEYSFDAWCLHILSTEYDEVRKVAETNPYLITYGRDAYSPRWDDETK